MIRFILIALLLTCPLSAEDLYFTQTGSGSHNGTIGNPWSTSEASNASNWGSGAGKISAGDTLHAVGTITSALSVEGSGTSGNVITVLFDSGAIFTAPYWATGYAILVSNQDYITIDGGATGTIGGVNGNQSLTNGIIECSANGTGLANQEPVGGITGANASHLTVKNLWIRKMYVRAQGDSKNTNETYTGCIGNYGGNHSYTDFIVDNCILSEAYIGLDSDYGDTPDSSNFSFTNLTVTKCNWGIHVGGRGNASKIDGITCAYSVFGNYAVWDDPAGDYHHNGFFIAPQDGATTGYQHGVRVYKNIFNDGYGLHSTSSVFMNAQNSDWEVVIYDNQFFCPNDVPTNSLITLAMHTGTMTVSNNSCWAASGSGSKMIGVSGAQGVSSTKTFNLYNNVAQNIIIIYNESVNAFTTVNIDHNIAHGITLNGSLYLYDTGSGTRTLAQWQGLGFDTWTINPNADPLFVSSADLHLQSGSPCTSQGSDQSVNYITDFGGVTWAGGAGWGIGAYKFAGASGAGGSILTGKTTLTGKATIK